MGKIALIADRTTSTYFKVSGIKNSYAVKDREDAEKVFRRVHSDESISLIMVTEPVYEWIQPMLERTPEAVSTGCFNSSSGGTEISS